METSYIYPHLCARCGSSQVAAKWEATGASARLSLWSLLTVFIGALIVNRRTYSFTVPVCADCHKQLYAVESKIKIIWIVSGVLGAILGIVLIPYALPDLDLVPLLFAGIMFGVVLGFVAGVIVVIIFKKASNYHIGYHDGERLVFYNKEFQEAVTALEAQMDHAKWVKRESPKPLWRTKE